MWSDDKLRDDGMRILADELGLVDAERFIVLMRRERFDYTQWRQGLYTNVPLETLLSDAQSYRDKLPL